MVNSCLTPQVSSEKELLAKYSKVKLMSAYGGNKFWLIKI